MTTEERAGGGGSDDDTRFLRDILRLFVKPELERRIERGEVEPPFALERFQVLMWVDRSAEVRLNDEVQVRVRIRVREGTPLEVGQPVMASDVEGVEVVKPEGEPNAAHATMLKIGDAVYFVFDFTYNRERSEAHLDRAREFLAGAEAELKAGRHNSAVELLWSAGELAGMAFLLTIPDKAILSRKGPLHSMRAAKFDTFGRLNFPERSSLLTDLFTLRKRARYCDPGAGELPDADVLLERVEEVRQTVRYAERRLEQ